jgi:hypothetical protein
MLWFFSLQAEYAQNTDLFEGGAVRAVLGQLLVNYCTFREDTTENKGKHKLVRVLGFRLDTQQTT